MRFEGKAVAVTGAASGLGRATALGLLAEGGQVLGIDRDAEGLATVAQESAELPGRFAHESVDITSRAECQKAVDAALASFGRLDGLANVAGVNSFDHFHELSEETWHRVLGVNATGTAFMCQAALPALIDAHGAIVNVASVAAFKGQAYTVAYCASKGAVVQLTRALAAEYVQSPVRINAIAPGGIDTAMNTGLRFPEGIDWELIKPFMGHRGMAKADEISRVIAFLLSDDARRVHGAIWAVDGGVTAT